MRTFVLTLSLIFIFGCSEDERSVNTSDPAEVKPFVEIMAPLDGDVLGSGNYLVQATAFHYAGIEYVRFKIGLKDFERDYSKPFECQWHVGPEGDKPVVPGPYQICAMAVSNSGTGNAHCIDVTVKY
jgi:hypothetical protein